MALSTGVLEPLGFRMLSQTAFIHHSQTEVAVKSSSPHTIIVFSWLGATARALRRPLSQYLGQFPNSRIILCGSLNSDFFTLNPKSQYDRASPAIEALTSVPPESLLVHVFSNGGLNTFIHFARLYQLRNARKLPVTGTVFDSSPGKDEWAPNVAAFSAALPKNPLLYYPGLLSIGVLMAVMSVISTIVPGPLARARKAINDAELLPGDGTKRLYIYGTKDRVVYASAVEESAAEAKQKGWEIVLLRFTDTGHLSHSFKHADEYWAAIDNLWSTAWRSASSRL